VPEQSGGLKKGLMKKNIGKFSALVAFLLFLLSYLKELKAGTNLQYIFLVGLIVLVPVNLYYFLFGPRKNTIERFLMLTIQVPLAATIYFKDYIFEWLALTVYFLYFLISLSCTIRLRKTYPADFEKVKNNSK
jgi:hypothetical protein